MKHIVPVALLLIPWSCARQESVRPNIVYIMTDDHGYQAVSAYGRGLNKTPNLDHRMTPEQRTAWLREYDSISREFLAGRPEGDSLSAHGDISEMVQNIDFAPTFLELAGVTPPADMQGVSLVPLLTGKKHGKWRDALYYHYYEFPAEHAVRRHYGVRTGRYKLIHFYNDIDAWELYDLIEDPHEMNNLIDDPDYDKVESNLRKRLAALRKEYNVPEE